MTTKMEATKPFERATTSTGGTLSNVDSPLTKESGRYIREIKRRVDGDKKKKKPVAVPVEVR